MNDKNNKILYAVIKIDKNYRGELLSLENSHLKAIDIMTKNLDRDKKKFDKLVYIDRDRVEIHDKTIKRKKPIRSAIIIQEFNFQSNSENDESISV